MYIDLDTTTQVPVSEEERLGRASRRPFGERDSRPLGALEATAQNRALVLLGDPGSGKSTFLNHLTFCLATHQLAPRQALLGELSRWSRELAEAIPIPVVLRDFAVALSDQGEADARDLWEFIVRRLEAQRLGFVADHLEQALEQGDAVILMDGLDEVPTITKRARTREAVAAFMARYAPSRYLLTCRTLSYQDAMVRLDRVPVFQLAPFDEARIDRFIASWYAELARLGQVKADPAADPPPSSAKRSTPGPVAARAELPAPDGHRPGPARRRRAAGCPSPALRGENKIELLLWRWEELKADTDRGRPRLRQLLQEAGRAEVDLKKALARLAFSVHPQRWRGEADQLADINDASCSRSSPRSTAAATGPGRSSRPCRSVRGSCSSARRGSAPSAPGPSRSIWPAPACRRSRTSRGSPPGLLDEGAVWRRPSSSRSVAWST